MVNGIAQNYGYDNYYLTNTYYNPLQMQNATNTTLFGGVEEQKDNTADGKDDGSIGFGGAVKNLAKGAWNFVTSPFKNDRGEWSLGSTLKSAAIAGLFIAGNALTGGALTPILLAGGAIAGVYGAGKAAYNIATAETDAQAEAAWQSMGASTATIVTTAVGAKGYAKASARSAAEAEALAGGATAEEAAQTGVQAASRYDGLSGVGRAMGKTFVDAGSNIKTGAQIGLDYTKTKFGEVTEAYKDGTLKAKVTDKYQTAKNYVENKVNDAKQVYTDKKDYWNGLTKDEKKQVLAGLKDKVKEYVKENVGSDRKEVWNTTKATLSNPRNLAIHSNLASQTAKPDFYDSLSTQEKAQFDSLPKEQREQIMDTYYDLV